MRFLSIPLLLLAFQKPAVNPPTATTQICLFQANNFAVTVGACPVPVTGPQGATGPQGVAGPQGPQGIPGTGGAVGLPLTAKDGNGTPVFQAGTAVVCPSAVPGPGATGSQITCPAGLYLPLQLVSFNGSALIVADNLSIPASAPIAPFLAGNGAQPPRMASGYTVASGEWVKK